MTPEIRVLRGKKRKCQSDGCGLPFYDLNRVEISCPNCHAAFMPPAATMPPSGRFARPIVRPIVADPIAEVPEVDEKDDADTVPEAAENILEIDEDGDDEALDIGIEEEDGSKED